MITITTLDGHEVDVAPEAIDRIFGPYPHDVGPHTYVHGATSGTLVTAEAPDALIGRLGTQFAKLTRPDGSPVWLAPKACSSVRAPLPGEFDPATHAVVTVGGAVQAVQETVAAVEAALKVTGA
ncbi:MAG TPA: hypothetical protein VM689_03100 [Aliidongia sp.]|nr:hypothetical protein [Aliidongia sp.]